MRLMDIKEVSGFTKVKVSTLYTWASSGLIPSFKLNGVLRFDLDEVIDWVKRGRNMKADPTPRKRRGTGDIDAIIKKAVEGTK